MFRLLNTTTMVPLAGEVTVPGGRLGPGSVGAITEGFEAAYRQLYGRTPLGVAIEALNWRVVMSGPAPEVTIGPPDQAAAGGGDRTAALRGALKTTRPAYFPETRGYVDVPVYDRYRLGAGAHVAGPAIVDEFDSTVVIYADYAAAVEEDANLVIQSIG